MPAIEPETQPSDVDTTGVIVEFKIPKALVPYAIDRLTIVQDAGSAGNVDWTLTEDSAANDDFLVIASDTGASLPVDEQQDWSWDVEPVVEQSTVSIYLEIIPNDDATLNDFRAKVHIDPQE